MCLLPSSVCVCSPEHFRESSWSPSVSTPAAGESLGAPQPNSAEAALGRELGLYSLAFEQVAQATCSGQKRVPFYVSGTGL